MTSLLVMVPIRGRRALCERMLKSFIETTDEADLLFILDEDDKDTYEGMDWGPANTAVLDPRMPIGPKFNHVAPVVADKYDALMGCGDDQVFRTPHWDTIMLKVLADMGGTGWVYPDVKRRNDIPEISVVSSDIVRFLGWFNSPTQDHYYADNIIGDLGRRTSLLRFCPEVVIEHLHYSVSDAERDETYRYAEETWGASDQKAYHEWRRTTMAQEVAALRREFNPDVKWLFSKIT
jgi:hypothetical protein